MNKSSKFSHSQKPIFIGAIMDALYGYDLFLSYTRADDPDSAFAATLKSFLEDDISGRKPARCFLDAGDLPHDESLTKALILKIRASRTLLVLAGTESLNHKWVRFEVKTALNFKRRIIILDRGVDWENCNGLLKDLLPEHVALKCEGTLRPTSNDIENIIKEIGSRRVESRRKRVWGSVITVLSVFLIVTLALLFRQVELTESERLARVEAEENYQLAKRSVDENFIIVEHNLKNVPGVEEYRKELLAKARDFYQKFVSKRKDDGLNIEYAQAIYNVGLIKLELGEDAESSFEEARIFLKQVALEQSDNIEIQHLLFVTGSSTGIVYIERQKYEIAEQVLRDTIQIGELLCKKRPHDRELHMDYWLAHYALGRAVANLAKIREAEDIFKQALMGMQTVREKLIADPDSTEKAILLKYVEEYVAGAYFNLANTKTISLEKRIEAARNSWRMSEALLSKYPTENKFFFRTAQACRLMAKVIYESGDAGEAQAFAERSLLIHRSLSVHYSGNDNYKEEFYRDLNFIYQLPSWRNKTWFHEAALDALKSVYDVDFGDMNSKKHQEHRIALAHLAIAIHMVQNAIINAKPLPTVEDKMKAEEHLADASSIITKLINEGWDSAPDSLWVMKANIPMLRDFTR